MKINLTEYPANDCFKFIREGLSQTQKQLSQKTGICESSIGNYENGRQDYLFSAILKIAKAYNLDIIIQSKNRK